MRSPASPPRRPPSARVDGGAPLHRPAGAPGLLPMAAFMLALASVVTLLVHALWGGDLGIAALYAFTTTAACWGCNEAAWRVAHHLGGERAHASPWREVRVLAGALVGVGAGVSVVDLLLGRTPGNSLGAWLPSVAFAVGGSVLALGFIGGARALERLRHARLAAEHAAVEAKLALLQSQLEPHMLFNTLANLRALIALDAPAAQRMLDHLDGYLRATLAASRRTRQPLRDEFARVADHLALMAVRMGPRLAFELDLPAPLRDVSVPSLIVQPLVENAIRHGLEPTAAGGRITVRAQRDGARLRLVVEDTGVGLPAAVPEHDVDRTAHAFDRDGGALQAHPGDALGRHEGRGHTPPPHHRGPAARGFGLTQVRERLATLHGDDAWFTLTPRPGGPGTVATVDLPWPDPAERDGASAAQPTAAALAAGGGAETVRVDTSPSAR